MTTDEAAGNIAILSSCLHRAEAIAVAIEKRTGRTVLPFAEPAVDALAGFQMVLIDCDTNWEACLELVRTIHNRYTDAEIILLDVSESVERVVQLAEAGADGYVTPSTSLQQLVTILQSVQQNEFRFPPHITYALFSRLADLARCSAPALPETLITVSERRVLDLLSQRLSNKEISQRLCIAEYTAKNHVHRILKKLGIGSRKLVPRMLNARYLVYPPLPAKVGLMNPESNQVNIRKSNSS